MVMVAVGATGKEENMIKKEEEEEEQLT